MSFKIKEAVQKVGHPLFDFVISPKLTILAF